MRLAVGVCQEGNKQRLLAQLTRKHWAGISAMAKTLHGSGGGDDVTSSIDDCTTAVAVAVCDTATAGAAVAETPPRAPRAGSLPRSRVHSFDSAASDASVSSRLRASMYKIPTFESMFGALPRHLAFDVEVKYPVEVAHRCGGLLAACAVGTTVRSDGNGRGC